METTRAGDVEERLAAAEAALEQALRERNRLWEQLKRQQADQAELGHLRAELEAVRSSRLGGLADVFQRAETVVLAGRKTLRRH